MAEKVIGGKEYRVAPLAARDAIALYADIMRIATRAAHRLPAIIVGLASGDETQGAMADVAALTAIGDILRETPTDGLLEVLERILAASTVKLPSGTYHQCELDNFTGNLKDVVPVARFVITVQYADFFIGSAGNGILSLLQEALRNRKQSGSRPT